MLEGVGANPRDELVDVGRGVVALAGDRGGQVLEEPQVADEEREPAGVRLGREQLQAMLEQVVVQLADQVDVEGRFLGFHLKLLRLLIVII